MCSVGRGALVGYVVSVGAVIVGAGGGAWACGGDDVVVVMVSVSAR